MEASEYFGTSHVRIGVISRQKLLALCASVETSPITVGSAASPRSSRYRRHSGEPDAKITSAPSE